MPHFSTKGRTPAAAALTIALLACLGLAACGGSSSTSTQTTANAAATGTTTTGATTPGTSSTPTVPPGRPNPARFTALRACLAKKGVTLPQRTPGAGGFLGGGGPQLPKGVTRAQYAEALKACGANFPGRGHFSRAPHAFNSPRFHEVLARFAACLRQNGVNVGEPNTSGKGPVFDTKGLNTGSTQFKAAEAKCRSTLVAGLRPKASPGAAGGGGTTG
jgi:hypothetical protein